MSYESPSYSTPPQGRGCFSALTSILLLLIGGAILLVAFLLFGLFRTGDTFLTRMGDIFNAPQPTPVVDTRAVVIKQMRGMSELTTAMYGMQTIADASKDRTLAGFVIGQTKILYVAYGEVRAGIDLSQLTEQDVEVISDTIIVRLPPPRLLDSKIDVNRSYVYDYQQSLFGPVSPELQTWAEQYALQQIVKSACDYGILNEANKRAETAVGTLLSTSGYGSVNVIAQSPDPASCGAPAAPAPEGVPPAAPPPP